jgi:hypothetical protein
MFNGCVLGLGGLQTMFVRLAGVGCILGFSSWAMAAPIEVKSVMVDAKLMKFPGFSIDGVDYDALVFEYGAQGGVEVAAVNDALETLQCGGQSKQNSYISVDYRGPEVIFRIKDMRKNRVLLLQQLDTNGAYAYGQGNCGDRVNLRARFEQEQDAWQTSMRQQLLAAARKQMETYMAENATLDYEELRFPLFYFSGDGSGIQTLNQAFDRAQKAFDISMEAGITHEADEALIEVAKVWEKELSTLANRKESAAELDPVRLALHRNLSQVYLFVRKFDLARRNDAMALSKGMAEIDSVQKRILDYERRAILSPQVAANLVLTANLYRYGQNAMMDKQLVEVANFAELKQALSQR